MAFISEALTVNEGQGMPPSFVPPLGGLLSGPPQLGPGPGSQYPLGPGGMPMSSGPPFSQPPLQVRTKTY